MPIDQLFEILITIMTYTWGATELLKGWPYIKSIPTQFLALIIGAVVVGGGIYGNVIPTDLPNISLAIFSVILTPLVHDKTLRPYFTAILEKVLKG